MATILLVEDDPDLRLLTTRALERAGQGMTPPVPGFAPRSHPRPPLRRRSRPRNHESIVPNQEIPP